MDKRHITIGRGTAIARLKMLAVACCVSVGLVLALAGPALASEDISSFQTSLIETNTATPEVPQAGGHPDLETTFTLSNPGNPQAAQNVLLNTPQGIFGNPNAVDRCSTVDFALDECPSNSQIGLITVYADHNSNPADLLGTAPIYDVVPGPEETARFSFVTPTLNIPIAIPVTVRTATDYGLRFTVSNITQGTPLAGLKMMFWGFPAAATHDTERFPKGAPGDPAGCPGLANTGCTAGVVSSLGVEPLTDNPTTCTAQPIVTELEVQTYQDPEHRSRASSSYPAMTGCDKEDFKPVLYASPTTNQTDSASGLNLNLNDPQFEGFAASPSEIKAANVTLPEGFTINPDAADGQSACADAQANFDSEGPANCPDQSKIGTFALHTVALNGALEGSVYIGEPKPNDQYRLFLTASGFGINAKLIGSVKPDPVTGRLSIEFANLPQVPFDEFDLHLFAGERALMATPISCTTYKTTAIFVPWAASLPFVRTSQVFGLESGPYGSSCPGPVRPFTPSLVAGTSNPTAGDFSSFTLKLGREDGDQYLGKLNFTLPPGLTANLHGIAYCPESGITAATQSSGRAEQLEPSCPANSQIGTTNVAAGPGSHPFHAVGRIYFAGPFQGAPLSLVAITPALAGPYDYGSVVVRVALHVDPSDAHVVADSETVPAIIGGIPIRMRSIQVNIDKSNFMINPTNCAPFTVASQGIGDQGTVADFSSPFHVDNCSILPFKPQMTVKQLGGQKSTRRASDPSLRFDLRTRAGDANIRSLAVTLPKAFEIDQNHLGNICSKGELEASHCAGRQPIGAVRDESPLLEQPLEGLAYAVSGYSGLPHVAFILGGQVMIVPTGESKTTKNGRLRTEVAVVPDVPIGHFQLTLFGGKHGYFSNTRDLCATPSFSAIEYQSQSGKALVQKVRTNTSCPGRQASHRNKKSGS